LNSRTLAGPVATEKLLQRAAIQTLWTLLKILGFQPPDIQYYMIERAYHAALELALAGGLPFALKRAVSETNAFVCHSIAFKLTLATALITSSNSR
jgi:hypothetical protein